jgi:hypothetical protein
MCATAPRVSAQETLFERLNLDKLRLTALGVAYGPVFPSKSEATQSYGITADYGEITRNLRVVFSVGYWGSEFTNDVVDKLLRRLEQSIDDPTGDATLIPARVSISDISLETDIRWAPYRLGFIRPYAGLGIGAHVINAESSLIADTFVESALDNIGTGLTGLAGVNLLAGKRVAVGIEGRFTLLSNVRFGTLRATGAFYLSSREEAERP